MSVKETPSKAWTPYYINVSIKIKLNGLGSHEQGEQVSKPSLPISILLPNIFTSSQDKHGRAYTTERNGEGHLSPIE